MSKEVGAGGRSEIFLDSGGKVLLYPYTKRTVTSRIVEIIEELTKCHRQ